MRSSAHIPDWARRWQRLLFDSGWLVPGWPPEYGGRNATPVQQMVFFEELAALGVPRSCNPQGLSIVTPSLLDYGTEEQKQRFALPTLRAEVSWCLGMSEPDAGSDLAGLRTRAVRDGDRFVVNGQKVWTSGAHDADYCFCFVRTDPDAPKHAGISVLVIAMDTPGIRIRPLPELTDKDFADFNEVFFEDVEVPAENLVGELNGGWAIAGGSLAHERGMLWISDANLLEHMFSMAVATATAPLPGGPRLADDPVVRDTLASAYLRVQAVKLLGYRGFAKVAEGSCRTRAHGPEAPRLRDPPGPCAGDGRGPGPGGDRPRTARRPLHPAGPGVLGQPVAPVVLGHDLGGDLRDPAQHHRRARPGVAPALRAAAAGAGPQSPMADAILARCSAAVPRRAAPVLARFT